MGSAPSTQRTSNVISQPQTALKESNIASNVEDPKKDGLAPSENVAKHVTTSPSKTCTDTTNLAVKFPENTASKRSPVANSTSLSIRSPELANPVPSSQTPTTLEAINSTHTKDALNWALKPLQREEPLEHVQSGKQTDIKDLKVDARARRRSRRGRGKGKGKTAETQIQEESENVPPPVARQDMVSRRRRARQFGQAEMGIGPAPRRGRTAKKVGGTGTVNEMKYASGRLAEEVIKDVKSTGCRAQANGTREHGRSRSRAGIRSKGQASRRLPPDDKAKAPGGLLVSEWKREVAPAMAKNTAISEADKANDAKTDVVHWPVTEEGNFPKSVNAPILPLTDENDPAPLGEKSGIPGPTMEGEVSILPPLPSSTRRRAKEYFQRRTRERSVDASKRQTHKGGTITEQGIQSDVQVPGSRLHGKENENPVVESCSDKPLIGWSGPSSVGKRDQFAFDPEASPFTPNATSSPRQASISSIGVQSFSSPTPLPSHGNRKVAPLMLAKTSYRSTPLETTGNYLKRSIPITSHHDLQGTHELAYSCTGAVTRTQIHLEAEQLALMRLQAYHNWLGGQGGQIAEMKVGFDASEPMDMSGGSGGLSGGVALGRQGQSRCRGKGQCRHASGAYAHPKEHVIFSPRDHERKQVGSQQSQQQQAEKDASDSAGNNDPNPNPKEVAQMQRLLQFQWDGKWGLRKHSGTSREVGWSWGGIGMVGSLAE